MGIDGGGGHTASIVGGGLADDGEYPSSAIPDQNTAEFLCGSVKVGTVDSLCFGDKRLYV